jgi:hypothetical protein
MSSGGYHTLGCNPTIAKQQLRVVHSTERESYAHRNIHLFKLPVASSFTMPQYCYSLLSPGANNIRLLRLMPPPANESTESTEVQYKLFEYSLQDLGKRIHLYEALSYAWDGEDKPCFITINEQHLNVTTNLYKALLRLRDRSFEQIIWVDAIYINQKDKEEQGQQVQLMAMIYSKAHRVLVWLGETSACNCPS